MTIFNLDTIMSLGRPPKPYNEALLTSIMNATSSAFVTIDSDSKILEWNKAAEGLFGWTRDEAIGEMVTNLILPRRYISQHRLGMKNYIKSGQSRILGQRVEVTALNKAGEELPIELTIQPMQSTRGILFTASINDLRETKKEEARRQLLMEELNHRIKNLMSVVQGVATQTLHGEDAAFFTSRLFAMDKAHDILFKSGWKRANLYDIVTAGTYLYGGPEQFEILGSKQIDLPANSAISFALIVHELTTNAIKYGALSKKPDGTSYNGRVLITWAKIQDSLVWSWEEVGGPEVTEPTMTGFGTRLIKRAFSGEGVSVLEYKPTGIKCTMSLDFKPVEEDEG